MFMFKNREKTLHTDVGVPGPLPKRALRDPDTGPYITPVYAPAGGPAPRRALR